MGLRNESNFSDIKYDGKKAELIAEKQEKRELGIKPESNSDYNSIRSIEQRGPVDRENKYNSTEEEESFYKHESKHVNIEDVADEDEESIIAMIDKKINKDKGIIEDDNSIDDYIAYIQADLDIIDSYGYAAIFEKLIESARASKDYKEIDTILDRTSLFIKEYQKILKEHLPENEEKAAVDHIFKRTVGDVVYMKDGEIGEKTELLHDYKQARDARPGANHGQRIYYSEGKIARGFLSQKEADVSTKNQVQGNQPSKEKKPQSVFKKFKEELTAYNPLTRKKEKI